MYSYQSFLSDNYEHFSSFSITLNYNQEVNIAVWEKYARFKWNQNQLRSKKWVNIFRRKSVLMAVLELLGITYENRLKPYYRSRRVV